MIYSPWGLAYDPGICDPIHRGPSNEKLLWGLRNPLFSVLQHATPALTAAPLAPTCPSRLSDLCVYGLTFWAWLGRGKMLPVRGGGSQPNCSPLHLAWLERWGQSYSVVLLMPETDKQAVDQSKTGLDTHVVNQFHWHCSELCKIVPFLKKLIMTKFFLSAFSYPAILVVLG